MALGHTYAEALAQGYAEADPTDDVEGDDTVAKTLILAATCNGYLEYPFDKMTISSFHPSLSLPSGTR